MSLATLPSSLDDVIAESSDDYIVDGYGNIEDVVPEIELENEPVVSETELEIQEEYNISFFADDPIYLDLSDYPFVYDVLINGSDYTVMFPDIEGLEVVDGYLVNKSNSSITGIISYGSSIDLTSYHEQTLTINPFFTSSGNTNAYKYGSFSYVTTYVPNVNGSSLSSTNVYFPVEVIKAPGLGSDWSLYDYGTFFAIFVIMLFAIIRGIFSK